MNILPRSSRHLIGLLIVALITPAAAHAEPFFAARITAENAARLPAGGMDAIGGAGDWLLTDGTLCAVISSREHPTYLSLHGGVLVDLWHCEKANDQWSTTHFTFNLRKEEIPPTLQINAGTSDDEAWVETTASDGARRVVTRYAFGAANPGALTVTSTITRTKEGPPLQLYGGLILHPRGSLTPFTIDTLDGEFSRGFDQPEIDTTDPTSIVSSASAADLQILLGSRHIEPSISYGVQMLDATHTDRDGNREAVMPFLMGGQYFTLVSIFSEPFYTWTRAPGLLSFLRSRLFDLEEGEKLTVRQAIHLADRSDAAAITDRIYDGITVSGQLDTEQAGITVRDEQGRSLTFVRPNPGGHFQFRLPRRTTAATIDIATPWSDSTRRIEVARQPVDLGALSTGAVATVNLPRDATMNLLFDAADEDPIFWNELTPSRVGGVRTLVGPESRRLSLAGSPRDRRAVQLAPGRYRVVASRGPEYSIGETTIDLAAGDSLDLQIDAPVRVVETGGLISADLHVHSGVSFDSSLRPEQRITDFVAQGCEILVPTEHNITYDLQPAIESMGLSDRVVSFPGVEITGMIRTPQAPTSIGHSNVFPVAVDETAFMGGTLRFEGRRLGEVIGAYKEQFPSSVFQLNHPRTGTDDTDVAFLNHLSVGQEFDPLQPLDAPPNRSLVEHHAGTRYRDIDFDAIELLSGEAMEAYESVRTDWFALLRQGVYKVATANSDSHSSDQLVALPRTYLGVPHDDPALVTADDVVAALGRGHAYGTTGPILRVRLDDVPPGGVFTGQAAVLHVRVDSAPWVDVDEIRIWINAELWKTLPIRSGQTRRIDVTAEEDSFVFVEAQGSVSAEYETVAPGFVPFAFANPIFIEVAGDESPTR